MSTDNPITSRPSDDPDAIRADIERTRTSLSRDVNALGEAVAPGNVARRQVDKVREKAAGVKDQVMGSASDLGESASGVMSGAGDAAHDARRAARRKARGNPMAAGLIALGAGWLLGSMLPASAKERELAETVRDKAEPALEEAQSIAKESAEHLKEPAQDAAAAVRDKAAEAADSVKDEGRQVADDVRDSAAESKDAVQEQAQG